MLVAGATFGSWVTTKSSSSSSSAGSSSVLGSGSNWVADTMTAIKNSQSSGGILGALETASSGSTSFISQSKTYANNFATISQGGVSSATTFYTQLAAQNIKDHNAKILQKTLDALQASQKMVKAKNVLNPVIYFKDGTTIDTTSNIMTKPDGTQYDITTGAKYLDPNKVIQLGGGAYVDTQNNILVMADGTQIDTVTGLKITNST